MILYYVVNTSDRRKSNQDICWALNIMNEYFDRENMFYLTS